MDSPETTTEENRRLRRTMRDLIALSTLPAIWIGVAPDRIAGSLADVLLNTLSLDFIYVRMAGRSSKDVVEVIRRKSSCENVITETLRAALAPFLSEDRIEPPPSIPNPFGAGSLSTTVTRFGVGDDYGLIVAGSSDAAFPTERDRLLLGVGANQTAIVIQRRRAEELVHEQREWLRVTLASIGDAVIATDTEGRVTFLNEVAEKLTGWTQDEAHSQALEKVFAIRNEQTRQPVENPVGIVLREGVIVGLANHTILVAKDGTERPIDDSAAPIRDSAGKMVGVVLIFRDVTEQRRIEREIRQSEARKRAILETALDCIITMDHEGNVVEFNPAAEQTFGFTREQVVGRELCELIVPLPLRDRHRKGMALYLATGKGPVLNKRIELPAMRADGSEFPAELSITHTSTDERLLFTAYLRDITEKKRSEQQRNLRVAVTQALSEAESTDDGVSGVLRAVCENFNWELGSFWKVDQSADKLVCCASWYMPNAAVAEFESASRGRTFEKAEGLPGRVWDSSKPAWIPDLDHDANFPRLRFATECGLHSAFACPIVVDAQTVGVIEFFTKRFREADAGLLETMGTVSGNIGQFIERNAAVDELRQSERQLADFFENATVGLHWVGPDGIILRANRVELEMLGYSRDEYVGQPIADFHADEEVICDILKRLRAGEKLTEYAARLRCKDGSIKDVLIDSSVLFKGNTFIHTRCFTRDITERKRAEAHARVQEQRTKAILESISDAFFSVDQNWQFVYVNRKAEELLNCKRDDLLGKNLWEEFAPTVGTVFEHAYRKAMTENVTVTFEAFYPPHDRWYDVHAYPSSEGLSVYFRDSSQRRQSEAALRESEQKLRLLADTIPQLAWMAHPDGHIFWYNQRWYEYTGTTFDQMAGWGWQSVHEPSVLPEVLERWTGAVATGEPFEMVFPLKGADDQFRPFLTRVNPLREEGRLLYWFGTNTDISEIKKMEEALRDTDRRKDEFLATLAHELRNPLAPIRNSLQILKMPRVDSATVHQTRDMMERQVNHLVRLVDDLLDVSRVMRGKIDLRKEPVELATIVARAVETVQPLIEFQGHQLEVSLSSESLLLDADPIRLVQVVSNLLTNAAKYTESNGHIRLTAERENGRAVLKIRDNGIGIAADMLPHVFELFVQVDYAATRSQGGLGIGLTLVKNLVQMHDGTVEARSAGLGEGCEFEIRLPLAPGQHRSPSEAAITEEPEETPFSGHRLLVVDDNRDAAVSLATLLRLLGHRVRVVHDGPSALATATSYFPDMIFLDIGMPGMDGYEVARRIREQPGLKAVVLTALTGWGQLEDRRRTTEAGFDHHLVKPLEPKSLEILLNNLKRL